MMGDAEGMHRAADHLEVGLADAWAVHPGMGAQAGDHQGHLGRSNASGARALQSYRAATSYRKYIS